MSVELKHSVFSVLNPIKSITEKFEIGLNILSQSIQITPKALNNRSNIIAIPIHFKTSSAFDFFIISSILF